MSFSRPKQPLRNWFESARSAPIKALVHIFCHSVFWLWNLLFLGVVYLGFMPWFGIDLVRSLADGTIPFPFVLPLLGLLLVPPACTIFGFVKLRKHPVLLMRLFYGVEAPILTLCVLRMFVFRELTASSGLMVGAETIAIATIALELTFGYAAYRKDMARFQMVAHTVVLIMGLYVGSVLLFYTVPLLCEFLYYVFKFEWLEGLIREIRWLWESHQANGLLSQIWSLMVTFWQMLLVTGLLALFGFGATLFLAMPYAMVNMFTRSWGRILQAFGRQYSWQQGWLFTGGTVATFSLLFLLAWPQPQAQAFARLADAPTTASARQTLIGQSPQIRKGLLNAHLYPYRYLSAWNDVNFMEYWYANVFNISRNQAQKFQTVHNALLSPFLYRGDRADVDKAAELYADFFDTPIQKAESGPIQHALESTVNRDSVEASLLNISDRVVALTNQDVTVEANGDWGKVTLYERYENHTQEDQEIVYQFSLPESAVITELWLKEPDIAERFRFVVSPRGAAQEVYKQEIERAEWTRATDPALLEQVGPRQYRLRIFPIPQREWRSREPGVTEMWMSYQVMQQDGAWPLPQLTEKRNLYWTADTRRRRNDASLTQSEDVWYEAAIPAAAKAAPAEHTAVLTEGYQVTATPVSESTAKPLQNQRLAMVVDTSRSMADRAEQLAEAVQASRAIARDNTIDWYVTSAPGIPAQTVAAGQQPAVKDIAFYGNLPLTKQLQQFDELRGDAAYDAVFVLTDAGNYELEDGEATIPAIAGSLWLVHLGDAVPNAYTDALQQVLADSQGGVTSQLVEAADRVATEQQTDGTLMDGYRWVIAPANAASADASSVFAPFAARQAIRWLSRDRDLSQVSELDGLHAIAKRVEVVTPYSSMLVLVDDRQRDALAEAEKSSDRFDREVEDGQDTLSDPNNPMNVVAIPEGRSPLGMVLGGAAVFWLVRRNRVQSVKPHSQKSS